MSELSEVGSTFAGLSAAEVDARVARGQTNVSSASSGRTILEIVRTNVLTRFNAILGSLFVVVLFVGPIQDGLFGIVLVVNAVLGVVQELRARRSLERLAVLTAPSAHALRDGQRTELPVERVVVDDVLELRAGDQIVADGEIISVRGLEVDESLLSGESMAVDKHEGDAVLSGSVVVAGSAIMRVTTVGDDSFAQRLQGDARKFSLARSDLQAGINAMLRVISWVMIPVSALLVVSQFVRSHQNLDQAIRATVAGVGAMVPEGLVLLTTLAFALGAIRLARQRVLVQELAAIEGLARVDVLCIDKTGTLTESGVELVNVVDVLDGATSSLGAMAWATENPNATMLAARSLAAPSGWVVVGEVVFSSSRKWSAMEFDGRGTWVIGAPEIVSPDVNPDQRRLIDENQAMGRRVLVIARCDEALVDSRLPRGRTIAGVAVLEERVRADARATIDYLVAQGVQIKVISGDNATTVAAVARRVGVPGAERALDARELPTDSAQFAGLVADTSVFGRVQPDQKRSIVKALQAQGHVVAMTGDGVNDIPALKAADLAIAMGSGSAATRAVGQIVLLDNSFALVPSIVDEGRRVIANIQRVAILFVTKTVYATFLALVVGVSAIPYPFYPRHLTVVSTLTIGLPGFFLALAPAAPRATPDFVGRVLRRTVPSGLVIGAVTLSAYVLARGPMGADSAQSRSVATLTLVALGLVVLGVVSRPLTRWRVALNGAMAGAFAVLWFVPWSARIFSFARPSLSVLGVAAALIMVGAPLVVVAGSLWKSGPSRR